jgi:hypothetical protein
MDSYVVRIYRRNSSSPQDLVGLVELVEVNQERTFMNFEELRAILGCRQSCIPEKKKTVAGGVT